MHLYRPIYFRNQGKVLKVQKYTVVPIKIHVLCLSISYSRELIIGTGLVSVTDF